MENKEIRVEVIVKGLVQGVGFRYFILRKARELGLTGYVQNLFDGNVLIVTEGKKYLVDELVNAARIGPISAEVDSCDVKVSEYKNEFSKFELRY
ncbi:MAG: acylphosphatase [Ignavibacteriales bacterium]